MPREKPIRAPLAEPAKRSEPRLDLVVGESPQLVEVEVGTGYAQDVLGLATGKAQLRQLFLPRRRNAFTGRKRRGTPGGNAKPVDEAAAHRECRMQRDLLRGDRGNQRLESVRRERRAEPRHESHRVGEDGIALCKSMKWRQFELEA